jgi:hypothetical protein
MVDETLAKIELFHFDLVDVQADDMVSFSAKLKAQRQSHVAETNDG